MTPTPTVDMLEADGLGCPMAHCNRRDNSFHDLPPLRRVETSQRINDPVVSPRAFVHLGAFTGETAAVCTYDSPLHPALVAYDHQSGVVQWASPLEDLPGFFQRWPSGILLAKMGVGGQPARRYVFAANPVEFVAYTMDGSRVWKRANTDITPRAPEGIGMPTSLTFTDARELVCATTKGWIVKLNPADGTPIDAYQMETVVFVGGRGYRGTFTTTKSPVVIGSALYLLADFKANPCFPPLYPWQSPVHLLRIELSQPGGPGSGSKIQPLVWPAGPKDAPPDRVPIGVYKGTGSPPALLGPGGKVWIFAHAHRPVGTRLAPSITAVEDCGGVLEPRWESVLETALGDDVYAAPALHADSGTLLVTTLASVFVFRDVCRLSGRVPPPAALPSAQLLGNGEGVGSASIGVGSPFALTFDPDADEIVAYTNFRLTPRPGFLSYGFLGAFALPAGRAEAARPLWRMPLGLTSQGAPCPGLGTFGQPALFRYDRGGDQATGLIVNTVFTGTYIFK